MVFLFLYVTLEEHSKVLVLKEKLILGVAQQNGSSIMVLKVIF
jgi:hypothetical protein